MKKNENSFSTTVAKPPDSPSTSGSITTTGNVTSLCHLDSGDEQLVNILNDMHYIQECITEKLYESFNERLKGYFCFKERLGLSPTPIRIKENNPKGKFNEFTYKMRCKWYFWNEPTEDFTEKPAFHVKSYWNLPDDPPLLEIFLSKLEKEILVLLVIIICLKKNDYQTSWQRILCCEIVRIT